MRVLNVGNVNEALYEGILLINKHGKEVESRYGKTLEIDSPVSTTYEKPWERVLINKQRDANPFFHLMESLWILAGRDDVKFLSEFNKNIKNYSDDGLIFNSPYGYRLRKYFNDAGNCNFDQLGSVIQILKEDPNSRQAVCQIWLSEDLEKHTKDKACNMSIVFRIRESRLCMVVYNRSNDMIWGAYGANAVQFSMIQEYVAAHLGLPMGEYTQVTNSYHVYVDNESSKVWDRLKITSHLYSDPYDNINTMVHMYYSDMSYFERDLAKLFEMYDQEGMEFISDMTCWQSTYFKDLVVPVLCIYLLYKRQGPLAALRYVAKIQADDWRIACTEWLETRLVNSEK